jgi:hypothetical protein
MMPTRRRFVLDERANQHDYATRCPSRFVTVIGESGFEMSRIHFRLDT